MNRTFLFIALLLLSTAVSAQQTLRIMHYNLLMYGINNSGCNTTNNNVNDKNQYLHTIVDYVNPHILTVNEINCSVQTYDVLLSGCLDAYMPGMFDRIPKSCNATNPLSNMVYFRNDILEFYKQDVIPTDVRDINVVRFYYKSPDLSTTNDTTFITLFVAHLKAGTGWDDEEERADETARAMQYISQHPYLPNRIFMGDLNIYEGDEEAFENLMEYSNASLRFYDPINEIGDWHNNSNYAGIHTQSTHTTQGCFISGGLDDRFDFILIDKSVKDNTDDLGYVPGSYRAVGQDGQHFNKNLLEPPANGSVPSYVLDALYNMSDHLPVCCDFVLEGQIGIRELHHTIKITSNNPVSDYLKINFEETFDELHVKILNPAGIITFEMNVVPDSLQLTIPVDFLANGMYFLRVEGDGVFGVGKFVVLR